jgi:hypothetical protein
MKLAYFKFIVLAMAAFCFVLTPMITSGSSAESQSYLKFNVEWCNGTPDRVATMYLLYDSYQVDVSKTNSHGAVVFPVVPNSRNYSYTVAYDPNQGPTQIYSIHRTPAPSHLEVITLRDCK